MAKTRQLTFRQLDFIQRYIRTGNAADSYREAYPTSKQWSRTSLDTQAGRLLRHPAVSARISEAYASASKAIDVTAEQLVKRLTCIAFQNIADVVSWGKAGIKVKSSRWLTPDVAATIKSVQKKGTPRGEYLYVEFHDCLTAIDMLCRVLGLYRDGHAAFDANTDVAFTVSFRDPGDSRISGDCE